MVDSCVSQDTFLSILGEGVSTFEDLNSVLKSIFTIPDDFGEAEIVTSKFFLSSLLLSTEQGHSLQGSFSHRVLSLGENGIARWVSLQDVRSGYHLFTFFNQQVDGFTDLFIEINNRKYIVSTLEAASLAGALAATEYRDGLWIGVITNTQKRIILEWAKKSYPFFEQLVVEDTDQFTSFTGLIKLAPALELVSYQVKSSSFLKNLRRASKEVQKAFITGLVVMKAVWTGFHLEFEVDNYEVARTFQAISENLGVRWTFYKTLNTFGEFRYKLALRSRQDQQLAEQIFWKEYYVPSAWNKKYSPEENECPKQSKNTLQLARDILEKYSKPFEDIELDDLSYENMVAVSKRLLPVARAKTEVRVLETLQLLSDDRVTFDRVTGIEKSEIQILFGVILPLGCYFSTNSIISHSSM